MLGRLPNLSVPQFPHLWSGYSDSSPSWAGVGVNLCKDPQVVPGTQQASWVFWDWCSAPNPENHLGMGGMVRATGPVEETESLGMNWLLQDHTAKLVHGSWVCPCLSDLGARPVPSAVSAPWCGCLAPPSSLGRLLRHQPKWAQTRGYWETPDARWRMVPSAHTWPQTCWGTLSPWLCSTLTWSLRTKALSVPSTGDRGPLQMATEAQLPAPPWMNISRAFLLKSLSGLTTGWRI